jgi:methylphosphotriester-DNA--protein-cysteine methyltransferase
MTSVRIFSNGTQAMDWECANCERCKKHLPDGQWPTCEIAAALAEAAMDDGTVSPEIAERAGHSSDEMRYNWPCGEVEWTEEWKKECNDQLQTLSNC